MNWPTVIAEIGINHDGNFARAVDMVTAAHAAGCECVKFQTHIVEDEYTCDAKYIIPPNARENIYDMMKRCSFTEEQERTLKGWTESLGMTYLSTPFSRAAADRLERMGVSMYKIGSGECSNYPLIRHIAAFGKPVILSTGMNDPESIRPAVELLKGNDLAILHCTSMYPTPYDKVRLGAMQEIKRLFPHALVGLSDHSEGIYTSLAAVALGAAIIEKHFTLDRSWHGADNPISILPAELKQLIEGARAITDAMGGGKTVLAEEKGVALFARASVVTIRPIRKGEKFTQDNLWVKRPGNGDFPPDCFDKLVSGDYYAACSILSDVQLRRADVCQYGFDTF